MDYTPFVFHSEGVNPDIYIVLYQSCEMSPRWQQTVIIHELRSAGEYVSLSDFRSKSD